MVSIEDIRKTFSKATIAISGRAIHVIYDDRRGFITQEFEKKQISVILELLEKCDVFGVSQKLRQYTKFSFIMWESPPNNVAGLFRPLRKQYHLKPEEIRRIVESDPSEEFLDFMGDVDGSDRQAFFSKFMEWMELLEEREGNQELPRNCIRASPFRKIRGILRDMGEYTNFEAEVFDRSVHIYFEDTPMTVKCSRHFKSLLVEAFGLCSFASVEVEVNRGFLNLYLVE